MSQPQPPPLPRPVRWPLVFAGLAILAMVGYGAVCLTRPETVMGLRMFGYYLIGEVIGRAYPSACPTRHQPIPLFDVSVTDEQGQPVDQAEVMPKKANADYWTIRWTPLDQSGRGTVKHVGFYRRQEDYFKGVFEVVVRAPGFAPAFTNVTLPTDHDLRVVMSTGRQVRIRLETADGRELPDSVRPRLVLDEVKGITSDVNTQLGSEETAYMSIADDTLSPALPLGDRTYAVHVPAQPERFYLQVDEPGFLRNFRAGPFGPTAADPIVLTLPVAAQLHIKLTLEEAAVKAAAVEGFHASVMDENTREEIGYLWVRPPQAISFTDHLAPGVYLVSAQAPESRQQTRTGHAQFNRLEPITLTAGQTATATLNYAAIDADRMRGDGRAVLHFRQRDGSPVAGQPWSLIYSDDEIRHYTVAEGVTPEDGRVVVENLRDNGKKETYYAYLADDYMGDFFFRGTNRLVEHTFTRAPQVGDSAPALNLQRLTDGSAVNSTAFQGRVVYLDFWATWCGPCQAPMAHLDEVARRRAPEWQDRVVLAAISIDDSTAILSQHLAKRKWDPVIHYWAPNAWGSQAAQDYGITGVPTALLIDRAGRIRWRGNPNDTEFDLEQRIEEALKEPDRAP